MTEKCRVIIEDTRDIVSKNMETVFNQGVVEGIKIVKNLIDRPDTKIESIDILKEALDLFIDQYDIEKKGLVKDEVEEKIEEVPMENIVLEDTDESEGNVYKGYIIPTLSEVKGNTERYVVGYNDERYISIPNVDETDMLTTDVKFSAFEDNDDNTPELDGVFKKLIKEYIDNLTCEEENG